MQLSAMHVGVYALATLLNQAKEEEEFYMHKNKHDFNK